jgi:RND superfamily putative drug exporter
MRSHQEFDSMQVQERTPLADEAPTATQTADPDASPDGTDSSALGSHGLYRLGLGYGRLIYRVRWVVLALWVIGLAASVPFASSLGSVLSGGGYNFSNSDSVKAANLAEQVVHQPASQVLVVFQSADAPVGDPAYQAELSDFLSRAGSLSGLASAPTQGPVGADGKTTIVVLSYNQSEEGVEQQLSDLRADLPASGPAKAYVTGSPAVYHEFNQLTQEETQRAEEAALPLALVVLVIVFGSLVAAAMPLALALFVVPIALAIVYAIAVHQQTSIFVLSIASIIGLGISIDYSLFMVRRFREELARGRAPADAVGWTVATAGEAIFFSGMTVMIGFAGLTLIGIQFMTSLGVGGATVVAVAVLAALTLLPALLGIIGVRLNALRIPVLGRIMGATSREEAHGEAGGFWHGLAMGVMRQPVLVILGVVVLLAALGWPIFSLRVGTPDASALPKSSEARQGNDILSAQFPQFAGNTIQIAVQSPDGSSILTSDNLTRLDAFTQWLDTQPHVIGVVSLTQFPMGGQGQSIPKDQLLQLYSSGQYAQVPGLKQLVGSLAGGDTTIVTVQSDLAVGSDEAASQITSLRAHADQAQGLKVYVGGFQAVTQDFDGYLYDNFPRAIAFILLATFVVLLLMFRSLLLPIKAILMNVLSVSAAYGVLVFVFEQGHFADQLNFTPESTIDSTIPILLFCVLFGLSMDYEVFLLSRIREEWLRTRDNRYAVARGLEKTGGVITNAALLFVIVTGAFTFTGIIITKEIGLGMTVAILVDAAIIRTLLVPATMRLLGRWNWWLPGFSLPPKQGAR